MGYRSLGYSNQPQKEAKYITSNNASTSALFFKVTEDLGGGTKANFMGEADFSLVKPSLANAASTNNGTQYTGGFFNGEQYLGLSGGLGDLKLGAPNSPALTAGTTAQPFGTGLGGGYSDTFGRMGTNAGTGISGYLGNATTSRIIRNERAAVYTTPTVAGFNGQIEYAFQNGNGKAQASSANADGTTWASNNNGYQAIAVNYNNGPVNAIAYSGKISAGAVAASTAYAYGTGAATSVLGATHDITYKMLAGNYTAGATTVYAGYTTTVSSNQTAAAADVAEDSKSKNVAVKYVVGNIDLLANYLKRDSNRATDSGFTPNGNAKLVGLGANYNFSKNTLAYFRSEKQSNVATNGQAADGSVTNAYGTVTITSVGLKTAF